MLNVGIVGFGLSGRYLQAPFFEENNNFNLKTIVSNSQNPCEVFPKVLHAKNISEILNDSTIDLVSICSPSATHFEYAKQCLLADKHVLVEKPFTATLAEAEELFNLAEKQRKIIAVFQNRRFDSDFLTVQKVIQSNILGKINSVEIRYDRYRPTLNTKKWKEVISPANGIIYDLGSHIIDQAIALFGVPKRVWGETFIQRQGSEIDDAFDILLDYGKPRVWLKSSLLVREDSPRYAIYGAKGSFVKFGIDVQEDQLKDGLLPNEANFGVEPNNIWGVLNVEKNGTALRGLEASEVGNWRLLFQNLYEAIVENQPLIIKSSEVLEQIKIIETVKRQPL